MRRDIPAAKTMAETAALPEALVKESHPFYRFYRSESGSGIFIAGRPTP
jgi:hypothetical protein